VKPLSPDAPPAAAALGAELRHRRLGRGLTLAALGARAGCSAQHISSLELAATGATPSCVAALDAALDADGVLLALLPAVIAERLVAADARAAARQRYDEDVDPTNRRGLLGGAAGAALGAAALGPAPVAAREVDPELPAHWLALLAVLDRHDSMFGAHAVLGTVRRELRLIAGHRQIARGELRVELLAVEARWTEFAAFLANDTGDARSRDAWTSRALRLAGPAGDADVAALTRMRQAQWAVQEGDGQRAVALAEGALRVPRMSETIRARVNLRAAHGYALRGEVSACQRHLDAAGQAVDGSDAPGAPTVHNVQANAARCWLWMQPSKAIPLYERALRDWPRDQMRDGGGHQARLALACAGAGELDRARVEGRRALAIARKTQSNVVGAELKRLGAALAAA
jgi:transcriptional regulator with XRE-family HTH domain